MADRLESLLAHFPVRANVLHTGTLCGVHDLAPAGNAGQLHLIKRGKLAVTHASGNAIEITEPTLLLYPRPQPHRFTMHEDSGADLACADIAFEGGNDSPLVAALPVCVCLPLAQLEGYGPVLGLLFEEAFEQRCGRKAVLSRLFELVLVQVLRHLMESGQLQTGLIAGLKHPRLRLAITAMHDRPHDPWSLDSAAATAGMSRSSFAQTFRTTVGCTPGEYLQKWRITLAQKALRSGQSLKLIVEEVGYASESALSRAFKAQTGFSPREWKAQGS